MTLWRNNAQKYSFLKRYERLTRVQNKTHKSLDFLKLTRFTRPAFMIYQQEQLLWMNDFHWMAASWGGSSMDRAFLHQRRFQDACFRYTVGCVSVIPLLAINRSQVSPSADCSQCFSKLDLNTIIFFSYCHGTIWGLKDIDFSLLRNVTQHRTPKLLRNTDNIE